MRIFRRPHKYKSGRVIIKSDIPLETEQITFIIDTINKVMAQDYYEPCYHISREIYYKIDDSRIRKVGAHCNSARFIVKILK